MNSAYVTLKRISPCSLFAMTLSPRDRCQDFDPVAVLQGFACFGADLIIDYDEEVFSQCFLALHRGEGFFDRRHPRCKQRKEIPNDDLLTGEVHGKRTSPRRKGKGSIEPYIESHDPLQRFRKGRRAAAISAISSVMSLSWVGIPVALSQPMAP